MLAAGYRPDIDGLRAVAVLAVVLFQAFPTTLPGGFVGVDVFFVISGFLISRIILEQLERRTFSLAHFYVRRVTRIFPALILVLAATYGLGWIVLFADEFAQLGRHTAGATAFVSNLVLWQEAGYFDTASDTKPLLHLWSLGIEEQFYIAWPVIVWATWHATRGRRRTGLLLLLIAALGASFVAGARTLRVDSVAAFYWPQTRIWELLAGGLLAWTSVHLVPRLAPARSMQWARLAGPAAALGAALLAVGLWRFDAQTAFPGAHALVPVIGSVLIIAAGPQVWLNRRLLSWRPLVWIGLVSFPLYLWHWPLLTFARIIQAQVPTLPIRAAMVGLSIALAGLTYVLIERRMRSRRHDDIKVAVLVTGMALIGIVGYHTFARRGLASRTVVKINRLAGQSGQDAGYGPHLGVGCGLVREADTALFNMCVHDRRGPVRYALIGDSKARSLSTGLARTSTDGGRWVFIGGNGDHGAPVPLLFDDRADEQRLARLALEAVTADRDIDTVVLATAIRSLFFLGVQDAVRYDPTYLARLSEAPGYDRARDGLSRFVGALVAHDKRVVLVVDNPALPDPKDCLFRQTASPVINRWLTRRNDACQVPLSRFKADTAIYAALLTDVQRQFPGQVEIFDASDVYCSVDDDVCGPMRDDRLLYAYTDHISDYAAGLVGEKLNRFLDTRELAAAPAPRP